LTVAAAPVAALSAEPTAELAALVTEPTALVDGLSAPEVPADPADAELVTAEAADVVAELSPGCSSCAAAWACLEKISRRKRIPAAAIANCAARTAARFASSCGIDSSYPHGTSPYTAGATKAPDKPCAAGEDEAFCTATTVHHSPVARQAMRRGASQEEPGGPL
jgi:Fe-S cluster biogenesis protein NfuA